MRKSIAFYLEIFMLLVVLLAACALLAKAHSTAHAMNTEARALTVSVQLAQNAAEQFMAGQLKPSEQPYACFDADGNETEQAAVYAVSVLPMPKAAGQQAEESLCRVNIVVEKLTGAQAGEVYRLETAKFVP